MLCSTHRQVHIVVTVLLSNINMNKVVDDIKKYGSVQRVMLGIQGGDVLNFINAQKEEGKNVDLGTNAGVYVSEVSEEGNGAALGLAKGDVITKFDGQKEHVCLSFSRHSTASVLAIRQPLLSSAIRKKSQRLSH